MSLSSVEDSEPTYSSINLLKTNEDSDALEELPYGADLITDDDEHNLICEKLKCRQLKPKQPTTLSWEKLMLL